MVLGTLGGGARSLGLSRYRSLFAHWGNKSRVK